MFQNFYKNKYLIILILILIIIIIFTSSKFNKLFSSLLGLRSSINKIDCVVSDWSEWSECDTNGYKTQTRTITQPQRNNGTECPPLTQSTGCVNCVVSDWGVCDTTNRTQTRSIITPPLNQGKACPELTRSCTWTPLVLQGNPTIIDSSKIIFNKDDHVGSYESYNIFENSVFIQFNIPEITDGQLIFSDGLIDIEIHSDIIYVFDVMYYNNFERDNYTRTPGDIFQINYNGTMVICNLISSNTVIWTISTDYSSSVDNWTNFNSKLLFHNNTGTTLTLSGIMFYKTVVTQPINRDCEFELDVCDTTTGTGSISILTLPLNQGKACPSSTGCNVDCLVSNWIDSSQCDTNGYKTQSGIVTQPRINNGKECPPLTQTVDCKWTPIIFEGNPTLSNSDYNTFTFNNKGDTVISLESYDIYKVNLVWEIITPNSARADIYSPVVITDNMFTISILPHAKTIRVYYLSGVGCSNDYFDINYQNSGDIFRVSYNNLVVTINLLYSNLNSYYSSNYVIDPNNNCLRLDSYNLQSQQLVQLYVYLNGFGPVTLTGVKFYSTDNTKPIDLDCLVSDWTSWSDCDNSFKTRTRNVIIPNLNQGLTCPTNLTETIEC